MHHVAMDFGLWHPYHAVQYSTGFIGMIGYILIAGRSNRKTAQQRIAVMAMVIYRIDSIGAMLGVTCQKLMLALRRPISGMAQSQQVMSPLHLLQEYDIGLHCIECLLQCVNTRTAAERGHAFVNVVGSDAKFHLVVADRSFYALRHFCEMDKHMLI